MKTNIITIVDEPSVVLSSKVVISEGRRPMRVVLRDEDRKFIVHTEYLDFDVKLVLGNNGVTYSTLVGTHACFDDGNYFDYNEFNGVTKEQANAAATACFNERSRTL